MIGIKIVNNSYRMVIAVFVVLIVSAPAVIYSGGFPLDFPYLVSFGANLNHSNNFDVVLNPYSGSGRYFPFYWVYQISIFKIVGQNINLQLFIQALVYLLGVIVISRVISKVKNYNILNLIIICYLITPLSENITTIGKPEILMFTLISFCIFFIYKIIFENSKSIVDKAFLVIIYILSLYTKETAIVLIVLPLTGIIIISIIKNYETKINLKNYTTILLLLILGYLISKIPYLVNDKNDKNENYVTYDINFELVFSNLQFYVEQQPDILIYFTIATFFIVREFIKILRNGECNISINKFIFVSSLYMTGIGYYTGLLIWRWPMSYYMLFPGIIFSTLAYSYIFGKDLNLIKSIFFKIIETFLISIIFIYISLYSYYIQSAQIEYSIIYSSAIQSILKLNSDNSIIFESYPFYSEFVGGTKYYFENNGNYNIAVSGIQDIIDPASSENLQLLKMLNIKEADFKNNYLKIPKENDFLLIISGNKLSHWFLRGVTPYYNTESYLFQNNIYKMKYIDGNKIESLQCYINLWYKIPECKSTFIGFKLYKILNSNPLYLWRDHYPDGWVRKNSSLELKGNTIKGISLSVMSPIDNSLVIKINGIVYKKININSNETYNFNLDHLNYNIDNLISFNLKNTINPNQVYGTTDKRNLGAIIHVKNIKQ